MFAAILRQDTLSQAPLLLSAKNDVREPAVRIAERYFERSTIHA